MIERIDISDGLPEYPKPDVEKSNLKIFEYLLSKYGTDLVSHTAVDSIEHENFIIDCISSSGEVRTVLELGTDKGISTALLAIYSNKVYTVDLAQKYIADKIWEEFGVQDRIIRVPVTDNDDKVGKIGHLDFDFCFVDDQHDYLGAKIGYKIAKRCGRILFHDYSDDWSGVKRCVDEIDHGKLTIFRPFAYWEAT